MERNTTPARPGTYWPSILILLLVPLLFYAPMVFLGQEPLSADTQGVSPFGTWGKAVERAGDGLPTWYPYIFAGMPSYGSFIYTPRSPENPVGWVLKPFPSNRGARYVILLGLAGVSALAFFRRQGVSVAAATTAAFMYSMTPYFVGTIGAGHATKLEALCLLPAFLLGVDLLVSRPSPLSAAFLALAAACLGWAHHPQIAFYGLLIGAIYGVGRVLAGGRMAGRDWARLMAFAAVAAIAAALLVAEPYLGVREYAPHSIRGGVAAGDPAGGGGAGWDYATAWSFAPSELVSFLFPGWFGLEGATYWGPMPFTQSTHYFGIVGLALAIVGYGASRGARRWTWSIACLVVLLIGFGRHLPILYGPMYAAVPFFNKFRVPSMIYAVLPLCVGALSAVGIDALAARFAASAGGEARSRAQGGIHRWVPRLLLAAVALLGVGILVGLSVGANPRPDAFARPGELERYGASRFAALQAERVRLFQSSLWTGLGLLVLVAAWLETVRRRRVPARFCAAGLGALLVLDILWTGHQFFNPAPKQKAEELLPVAGAVEFLKHEEGPFRILPTGQLGSSNAFGLAGLESVSGYQPAKLRIYQDLIEGQVLSAIGVLRMLNVHYVVSEARLNLPLPPVYSGDGLVYPLPDPLPRAWSVEHIEVLDGWDALRRRLGAPDFRPEVEALVAAGDPRPPETSFAPARVERLSMSRERISFQTESEGASLVVLSEIWYHPGWSATIDGQPAELYRVNHVLRAVRVPGGSHEVVISARGVGAMRGRMLSRAGGMLLVVLLAWGATPGLRQRMKSGSGA